RHVCWAYMIGPDRKEWQLNDNGEPSGTAGKPILGQINSLELTDVVVIVVRYFGGIKLGTPGLIAAYREAARLALEDGGRKEMHEMTDTVAVFPYVAADGVMKIVKGGDIEVVERTFDNTCMLRLRFRKDMAEGIMGRLRKLDGVDLRNPDDI
ncbi:MAG: YigZ family protein, partial [Muribaculaceae bacterium]|nr:YigZ family protein [Muribaculaceae bacterium]